MGSRTALCSLILVSGTTSSGQAVVQIYSDKDAVIGYHYSLNSENTNYNSADWYGALSQPGNLGGENNSRSLIHFDLSDFPPGSLIDEATLDLFGRGAVGLGDAASVGNIGANACYLEQITEFWEDNTVTWNTQPSVSPVNAVSLVQSTQLIQDYMNIEITAMVQAMINDPSQAQGILLRVQIEDPTRGLFFCGNAYANPAKRPRLNIKPHGHVSVPTYSRITELHLAPNPVALYDRSRLELPEDFRAGWISIVDPTGRSIQEIPVDDRSPQWLTVQPPALGRFLVILKDRNGVVLGYAVLVGLLE
ncbi:MAG: DNRLRE domain-containing protein [Flavobacteriales bacterium]|nr:DNRLRE domain-containing protein [Flavobacteriales bacterium]